MVNNYTRRDFLKKISIIVLSLSLEPLHLENQSEYRSYSNFVYGRENLHRILKEVDRGKRYTFIGENHLDDTIEELIFPLIDSEKFSSLYLEALPRGNYNEEGGIIKEERRVYRWNIEKYERIIERALEMKLEVYGIDSHHERMNDYDETSKWAEYIIGTDKGGPNLTLVGSAHVNYWRKCYSNLDYNSNLPAHLAGQGIPQNKILTVTSRPNRISFHGLKHENKEILTGLYRLDEIPQIGPTNDITSRYKKSEIADYVWFRRPRSQPQLF